MLAKRTIPLPPNSLTLVRRFEATKSTKGASKLRRDLINTEIAHLRDLLPLPSSTRQRLSQLQLMALVCVYVRKANYFHQGECPNRANSIPIRSSFVMPYPTQPFRYELAFGRW